MADLNALIAQGVQFKAPPDPFAQYAKMQELQRGEETGQMNQMLMQEKQRGFQEYNALRGVMSRPGFDLSTPASQGEVYKVAPTLAENIIKGHLGNVKTAAETKNLGLTGAHTQAQTDELAIKAIGNTFDNFTKLNSPLTAARSPESVAAYVTNLYSIPLLGAIAKAQMPLEQAIRENVAAAAKDPQAWITAHSGLTGSQIFETLKGTSQTTNLGSTSQQQTIDAFGRPVGPAVSTPITPVPSTEAALQSSGAAASQAATAAKRLTQENQGVTYQTDANGNIVAMQSRLAPGETPTARSVVAPGGGMQPLKAKPTALAEKTKLQQQQLTQNLGVVIGELKDAVKEGGLIDQSTGGGAGRLADVAMNFVGQATPGAIAIGKLQPIADLALKMVPRFEGPQSDKDTASYKQAAGQLADATLPTKIRKEAAKTVIRLMENRKSQFMSSDMAAEGVAPSPTGSIHDQADAILKGK